MRAFADAKWLGAVRNARNVRPSYRTTSRWWLERSGWTDSGKPGPGHYVLSDAIPLSKLSKPLPAGDYTLKMRIVDTVTKQSYTLEQNFKITTSS